MPRAPFEVLVYPYRWTTGGSLQYALLQRRDVGWWQGVTGGGENDESPPEAARREACEETGASTDSPLLQLSTVVSLPVAMFRNARFYSEMWGDETYVIPQYCFGLMMPDSEIVLSSEHTKYRWLSYEEAQAMIHFEGNGVALWELHARLTGLGVQGLGMHGLERILPKQSDG